MREMRADLMNSPMPLRLNETRHASKGSSCYSMPTRSFRL
jgi:hypothetical protein